MKIRGKLLATMMSTFIPALLLLGYGALISGQNANKASNIVKKRMPGSLTYIELEKNIIKMQKWITYIGATRAAEGYDNGDEEAEKYFTKSNENINKLSELFKDNQKEQKVIEEIKSLTSNYYQLGQEVAKAYVEGGAFYGNAMLNVFSELENQLNGKIRSATSRYIKNMVSINKSINAELSNSKVLFITLGSILFIFGILINLIMSGKMLNPIYKLNSNLKNISEGDGDLTVKLEVKSKDEIGELSSSFNTFVSKIRSVIKDVKDRTTSLARASDQIKNAAINLSSSANEQAANVEEVSSSIEEMGATISQNSENAKNTDKIANETSHWAEDGGRAVDDTISSMQKIAEKITLIEDIANQTNLLALNAAIEAARASEHGRGFAVVADEVRKLAIKSQTAAQEIGELAAGSVQVSDQAGKLLNKIVPSIKKTADLVQDITAASEQQETTVDQINTGMEQLNEIAQQNAASSEELSATSDSLSAHAQKLQDTMAFFKVEDDKIRNEIQNEEHLPAEYSSKS